MRLWGTIGWIAASWPFVFILDGKERRGHGRRARQHLRRRRARLARPRGFCLVPAQDAARRRRSRRRTRPSQAIKLLAVPSIAVLFVVTFLDALVHQCYFQWTSPFLPTIGVPEN